MLVVCFIPAAPNIVQARAESSLFELCRAQPMFNLLKSAARVTHSRSQLPNWGFANLLATQLCSVATFEPTQASVPQLGSWGLLAGAENVSEFCSPFLPLIRLLFQLYLRRASYVTSRRPTVVQVCAAPSELRRGNVIPSLQSAP